MNKLEFIERMMISGLSKFQGLDQNALDHVKEQHLCSTGDALVADFNYCSRDCHAEYLGGNEFVVTIKASAPSYYRSKYSTR
jgi:hypothetical protein